MRFETILITPTIAWQLLEGNIINRRISKPKLETYIKDIQSGRWKSNTGETIKVSKTNRLIDGQHRLIALIKTNQSLEMTVAYGLDDSVFDVIDTGKSRSAGDAFKISGILNANTIPSFISYYMKIKNNYGAQISNGALTLTNKQVLDLYYERPNYWQEIHKKTIAWYISFSRIVRPSLIAALYAHLHDKHGDNADLFMDMVFTGKGINNDTVNILRNRLISNAVSKSKLPMEYILALFIKTWNAVIKRKELRQLGYNSVKEDFPKAL